MTDRRPVHPTSPTVANSPANTLASTMERNIAALVARRAEEQRAAGLEDRAADAITGFVGSMPFVYIHLVLFGLWITINIGWLPLVPAWDPSLVILAMAASVEAIFLSTFVLISQNRMAAEDNRRAELNLHISMLNEHETTRLLDVVTRISDHLGIVVDTDGELAELKKDVAPEAVLDRLEAAENASAAAK